MPNIVFQVGSLDLSNFIRVNPNEGLDLGQGDMLEPAWSDSPLYEGQTLTSLHVKNKELKVPLYLHPPVAPYTNDALHTLVQQVNQALRPVTDLGLTVYAQWQNAQATNPTFFTVQFARFEPNFNFRISEKGWLAGILHLWVLPYAHTATERLVASVQNNGQNVVGITPVSFALGSASPLVGDVTPQFDIRLTTGSYVADDGRITIMSALPIPSYSPQTAPSAFIGVSASGINFVGSGAANNSFLALDSRGASAGAVGGASNGYGQFAFALSPGSVYAGDNRVLGFVRARANPFTLRAFDPSGQPIGPTAIASAVDGWQLIDYGLVRIAPWVATAVISVQAYDGPNYSASGMFAPVRAAPAWTKEIGPVVVLPNNSTIFGLDFNSAPLAIDGFDGANGAFIGQDQLGNSWSNTYFGTNAMLLCDGNSRAYCPVGTQALVSIGSAYVGDQVVEAIISIGTSSCQRVILNTTNDVTASLLPQNGYAILNTKTGFASMAVTYLPGVYHMKVVTKASIAWMNLGGPSGAFAGAASGAVASVGAPGVVSATQFGPVSIEVPGGAGSVSCFFEAFRARTLASTGGQPRDIVHLSQPLLQHTRGTPSGIDIVDLQARQRGPIQAIQLPMPSLGQGLFVLHAPFDQGPVNDKMNVDVRVRERFTYAR